MTAVALRLRRGNARRGLVLVVLGGVTLATLIAALAIGAAAVPPGDIVAALLGHATDTGSAEIVLDLRLPRALLAAIVGASLGVAGAALQGLFRNPLADPGLIGVSSGAAVAAAAAILFADRLAALTPVFDTRHLLPVAAFAGGLVAAFLTQFLARAVGGLGNATLILAGIAVNTVAGAAIGFLIYAGDDRQLRDITFWMMGSLSGASWFELALAAPFSVLGMVALLGVARPLDAMLLGEREASHLGVDVRRTRRLILIASAAAVGVPVAVSGIIGLVGLVVPHLVRLGLGAGHRLVLPGSAMLGAILMLVADAAARTVVAPAELPIGLVTSAIGGPFFVWLLLRSGRRI